MSSITAGTSAGTALVHTADTTGAFVVKTGAGSTTGLTVDASQITTLANPLPVASGGTGSAAGLNLATSVTGTLPIANGGTNSTATATAGGAGYGTGTAHAYTAVGTSGQFLQSNGASAPTWATVSTGATLGTVVTTTSGTVAEFTGIPATVKTIFINFNGVSFAVSTQNIQMQLGDATAYVTSGYVAGVARVGSSTGISNISGSASLAVSDNVTTAETFSGNVMLSLLDSSTYRWSWQGNLYCSQSQVNVSAGTIALTGVITRLKIFGASGTVAFDAGSINIAYF